MLKRKFKAKWIAALRSGKFKQGHGTLKCGEYLCCIGVGYVICTGDQPQLDRTAAAAEAIGLSGDEQEELIAMNDGRRKSFPEIADWIEKNL